MADVDSPSGDLTGSKAAALCSGASLRVLYAQKVQQAPSVVNIETQEVRALAKLWKLHALLLAQHLS